MGRAGCAQAIAVLLPDWLERCGEMGPEVKRTGRGARLVQNGSVLSEVLAQPGPTNSVFDALAALVRLFSPGARVGLLGFAGGGIIAPLRAMGGRHSVFGVDLDPEGYELFINLSLAWMGEVQFTKSDAVKWLSAQCGQYDMLVEDLSVGRDGDIFKPDVSIDTLPEVIRTKLKPCGVAVFNLLPSDRQTWTDMTAKIHAPFRFGLQLFFESYYNRVLVVSNETLPEARVVSRHLRKALEEVDSLISSDIRVRTLNLAK
tara:strand:- start:1832 stop:2608 length:777 start_codon:yes stop_codon:yes gene_type:complete